MTSPELPCLLECSKLHACPVALRPLNTACLLCCHSCTHGVDFHAGLAPVYSRLDQLHLAPAKAKDTTHSEVQVYKGGTLCRCLHALRPWWVFLLCACAKDLCIIYANCSARRHPPPMNTWLHLKINTLSAFSSDTWTVPQSAYAVLRQCNVT